MRRSVLLQLDTGLGKVSSKPGDLMEPRRSQRSRARGSGPAEAGGRERGAAGAADAKHPVLQGNHRNEEDKKRHLDCLVSADHQDVCRSWQNYVLKIFLMGEFSGSVSQTAVCSRGAGVAP